MWRKLTEQDIRDTVSEREYESYARAAEGPQWDPETVARVIRRTSELVRGYVASSPRGVRMHPDGESVPGSLIGPAADYALVTLLRRVPREIRKERLDARAEAVKLFERVAKGEAAVEPWDGAGGGGISGAELVSPSRRRASSRQLEDTP